MKKTILLLSAVVVTIGITSGVVQALQTIDDDLQVNGNTTGIGNAFYTQNLRVNGSFSIGTNAPAQRFHLYSGSGTTMRFRIENGEGGCDFATDQNKFFMYVNNGVRMMIDEAGRVGIGTQSPTQRLHVAGTARVDVLEFEGCSDNAERFNFTGFND